MYWGGRGSKLGLLQYELEDLLPSTRGYRRLMYNVNFLAEEFATLKAPVREDILKYARLMGKKFTNPEIENIVSMDDHNRYCFGAAGLVGYQVTKILEHNDFISKDLVATLMPHPGLWKPGINLANDFGAGLQKVNDIKGFFEDFGKSIHRWPKDLLESYGYGSHADLVYRGNLNPKGALPVLGKMVDDAVPRLFQGVAYIDALPSDVPAGVRMFLGATIGHAAGILHNVYTPDFFANQGRIKTDASEFFDVNDIVMHSAREGESLKPFLEYMLYEGGNPSEYRR